MDNITPERYELYLKALKIDSCEMDMRLFIFNYRNVLGDYCDSIVYDMDELELIVDAFLYFTKFQHSNNIDRQEEILQNLLQNQKNIKDISNAEMIILYAFVIFQKIMGLIENSKELSTVCSVLHKMLATAGPIEEYENEYGDIDSLIKEMKKRRC